MLHDPGVRAGCSHDPGVVTMTDIYQQIWDADQTGSGVPALGSDSQGDDNTGYVRVSSGPASKDLRILSQVVIPTHKQKTYDLVTRLFDNYALSNVLPSLPRCRRAWPQA